MHAISVKYLRNKLPFVRSELKKGTTFLIIHKSQPIAKLEPFESFENEKEEVDKEWEQAVVEDLDKALGNDYLSKEEVDYYLSLPKFKK
jgi:hypothetical protein